MSRQNQVRLALALAALCLGAGQGLTQPRPGLPPERAARFAKVMAMRERKVTQAEREAAAARLAALRKSVRSRRANARTTAAVPVPTPGGVPDYVGSANWAYSPPLRKFVDTLPLLGPAGANNLGQFISVAVPDTVTYPGSDYYEIELRQYQQQLHSDLPPTTLRGYVQTNNGTDANGQNTIAPAPIRYLGPLIIAQKNRPVRIKFTNSLPTGAAGDLFIPVDTTVMGAGPGPVEDPNNPGMMVNFTQNRATLHLHGGKNPWISDGTPHQWITPAGEATPYKKGVSVRNVPDMPDPGEGSQTFYWSNQQSARLMFYHDHAWGITRLNVYVGEAAGYLLTDQVEQKLIADGIIPSEQIPLIIQDKTFVDATTIRRLDQDPTWNWGTGVPDANGVRPPVTGDLWYPHVYVPAQNPYDLSGMNPYGRWHYGPWFWPPTQVRYPPVPNPYYDPVNAPWEPPEMPGVPHPSMPGESFFDTPLVNGTAFPTVTLQPKAYRFRILNASNDRFWNLQLYVADPTVTTADGRTLTEVKMVPAAATPGFPDTWPTDGRDGGVPDPATAGPGWIQIGSEGGFLPAPAVIPNQPINWNLDPTTFNFGNVSDHSLLLGCAERADVIVDFSQYAGKTLILYNDAPAAFPALDARYDYYTGAPDLTSTGGHPGPQAGFGPNTRTIMQIKIADAAPAPAFDLAALEARFQTTATQDGVFKQGQDPIVVAQPEYNSAYNATFPRQGSYSRIFDNKMTFQTVGGGTLSLTMEPKAIQDEMGEAFDPDYGRMSGKLGLEMAFTHAGIQTFVLQNYVDPSTEILQDCMTPMSPVLGDGTQIWKITHNGVDTHPIHFHLFDVQLINRVGWDNAVRLPDANELGWKDTVRISPLEDTIVALRPVAPKPPFGLPDSQRPLNPAMPLGSMEGFTQLDPRTGFDLIPPLTNQVVNFGWEYVWHCHILSHEEMDMMRPIIFNVARTVPDPPVLSVAKGPTGNVLTWTEATPWNGSGPLSTLGNPANEIGYRIERATAGAVQLGPYSTIGWALANAGRYVDTTADPNALYSYRVYAFNAAGESAPSNPATTAAVPSQITDLSAVATSSTNIRLTWSTPFASNGVTIERSLTPDFSVELKQFAAGIGGLYNDSTAVPMTTYYYRATAYNGAGPGPTSNVASATTPATAAATTVPAKPGQPKLTRIATTNPERVNVAFTDGSTNEQYFSIRRAVGYKLTGQESQLVEIARVAGRAGTGTTVTFLDTTVQNNCTYTYAIYAVNTKGASLPSRVASITTGPDAPAAPSNLTAQALSGTSVRLSWTDNSLNERYFYVRGRTEGGTVWAVKLFLPYDTTSTVINGLEPATLYEFWVEAQNVYGNSPAVRVGVATLP